MVTLVADQSFMCNAHKTIEDVRTMGKWKGDIVLIVVAHTPTPAELTWIATHRVLIYYKEKHVNVDELLSFYARAPMDGMADERHLHKTRQWNKLYVFDLWFLERWSRMVYLDAGLRVFDTLSHLLELPWHGQFLAPDDSAPGDNGKRFRIQVDPLADVEATRALETFLDGDSTFYDEKYFLNCIFVFDIAAVLFVADCDELIASIGKFPHVRSNEMALMNIFYRFRDPTLWCPFPEKTEDGEKYLFVWNEQVISPTATWRDACYIKYSCS